MPIPKRILKKDIRAESLEELLDAEYIRLVVDETGLNIQVTDKGDRVLFEDPSYARFKNKFLVGSSVAVVIILFSILFFFRYKIYAEL
jgi:hypothetical protein